MGNYNGQVLLPLTLLIIFNSFLIHSVRESKKLRQVMTQRQTIIGSDREERAASNEIRITITLIAVVIMFLVCQLPTAATLIYKIFNNRLPQSNEEAVLLALGNIFNCLVSINAACNFLLYCALSDKYRRTFMWTFCRCLYRPASPVHTMAFFTQVDDHGNHQINHIRQSSIRTNHQSLNDRYNAAGRLGGHGHHHRSQTTSAAHTGSYLSIPEGTNTPWHTPGTQGTQAQPACSLLAGEQSRRVPSALGSSRVSVRHCPLICLRRTNQKVN